MEIEVKSEEELKIFGARFGALLSGGEVIELVGDVGAGKTTFVKGVAVGMGIDEDVQSPSFTINRLYEAVGSIQLSHYDFYRLQDPGIMSVELQESLNDSKVVTIIEWAEIVNGVLPVDRVTIRLSSPTETSRHLSISSGGEKSHAVLEALR